MQYTSLKSYKLKKGKFISPWNELATPMEDNKSWTSQGGRWKKSWLVINRFYGTW